jgi:transcriptional regulator with XRE-family HTH domain
MSQRRMVMRIRRLRDERQLTQEQLAHKAKISVGYLARLETGRHDPKLSTLRKIATALGVPVTDLLE